MRQLENCDLKRAKILDSCNHQLSHLDSRQRCDKRKTWEYRGMIWKEYKEFSDPFLSKHYDLILHDTFHHIIPLLLYPLNCGCKDVCICADIRAKIALSLNTHLYIQALETKEDPDKLDAMKLILRIPDESFFKMDYVNSYPIWLIRERFLREDTQKNLAIVYQLIWTLIRLAKTYETSLYGSNRGSIKEAISLLLGDMPLKAKTNKARKDTLYGEKAYSTQFTIFKPVSHFVVALKFLDITDSHLSLINPNTIEMFLSIAHWVRERLLTLETPNIRDKSLFQEKTLLSLPSWVTSHDIKIHIDPFEQKLHEINEPVIQGYQHRFQ